MANMAPAGSQPLQEWYIERAFLEIKANLENKFPNRFVGPETFPQR